MVHGFTGIGDYIKAQFEKEMNDSYAAGNVN